MQILTSFFTTPLKKKFSYNLRVPEIPPVPVTNPL
jgi:hypothetical protein